MITVHNTKWFLVCPPKTQPVIHNSQQYSPYPTSLHALFVRNYFNSKVAEVEGCTLFTPVHTKKQWLGEVQLFNKCSNIHVSIILWWLTCSIPVLWKECELVCSRRWSPITNKSIFLFNSIKQHAGWPFVNKFWTMDCDYIVVAFTIWNPNSWIRVTVRMIIIYKGTYQLLWQ